MTWVDEMPEPNASSGRVVYHPVIKGTIGTGAPPPAPTDGWEVTGTRELSGGTYYFLNVGTGQQRARVQVKGRADGTFLCTVAECLANTRKVFHASDDSYAGCIHVRFVRDHLHGKPAAHDVAPPPLVDADFPADALDEPDDEPPPIDENGEHIPPF